MSLSLALAGVQLSAQESLRKLESKLQPPTSPAGAATPAAGSAPGAGGAATTQLPGYLGASVDETPEMGKGVLVTGVKKGAPSELGGLKEGDVIVGINGKPCRKLDDLDAVLGQSTIGSRLSLQVQRAGKLETKVITLGRRPIEAEPASDPSAPPTSAPPTPTPPSTTPSATPPSVTTPPTVRGPTTARPPAPGIGTGAAPTITDSADPGSTPPSLRGPLDPTADPTTPNDPLATPARDPALTLPEPPGGDLATPAPLDPPAGAASGRASLGIQVVPLNDETRAAYDVRSTARQGALIVAVKPGSAADTYGIPIGGVVASIDGQLVRNSDDLVEAISAARPGQEVELRYYQGDRVVTKAVRLASAATARSVVTPPPPRPGLTPAGTPERPLLRKFEDMVESLTPGAAPAPTAGSSIFDPSRLTEMHNDLKSIREQLESLDKRVKALEEKGGTIP
jgi:membrane-associated protease RseP (regulator of RpoE activity)